MKRKSAIIVAILIMSIGFAAISTTLIINGNAHISENTDDFSVIFTSALLDGQDVYANVISQDKKTITFETKELKSVNDSSVLTYEITNNSSNYDAEVSVNCKVKDNTEAKYTSIKNELENNATKVLAKETLNGTLTITLEKTATEEVRENYVCELTFNAVERDKLGYVGETEWTFDYTGGEQTFVAPVTGAYKLETWGAQGGNYSSYSPGYGGYSTGNIKLNNNDKLYVNIGGKGTQSLGGYNGGGATDLSAGGGGGATHIATTSGLLSVLEKKKNNILIVSGGGGGSGSFNSFRGGSAGGFLGSTAGGTSPGNGGTQTTGGHIPNYYGPTATGGGLGLFGIGGNGGHETAYSQASGAGGAGFYGGSGGGARDGGGGGGSSYIGNSLLTEKSMYCYNCEESTDESTKTISTTCTSETPTENCAKTGNGYARITLIR